MHYLKLFALGAGVVAISDYAGETEWALTQDETTQKAIKYLSGGALLSALGFAGLLTVAVKAG